MRFDFQKRSKPHVLPPDAGTSPQFVAQPSNRILALERDAVLDCGVTGTPPPSVTWYKDDATLALDARVQQLVSGSLSVSDVRLSDGGDYYCVASNAVGSVRSLTASVELASEYLGEGELGVINEKRE